MSLPSADGHQLGLDAFEVWRFSATLVGAVAVLEVDARPSEPSGAEPMLISEIDGDHDVHGLWSSEDLGEGGRRLTFVAASADFGDGTFWLWREGHAAVQLPAPTVQAVHTWAAEDPQAPASEEPVTPPPERVYDREFEGDGFDRETLAGEPFVDDAFPPRDDDEDPADAEGPADDEPVVAEAQPAEPVAEAQPADAALAPFADFQPAEPEPQVAEREGTVAEPGEAEAYGRPEDYEAEAYPPEGYDAEAYDQAQAYDQDEYDAAWYDERAPADPTVLHIGAPLHVDLQRQHVPALLALIAAFIAFIVVAFTGVGPTVF